MSIKHLQDLPVRQFLDVIQRFDEFTITEKVDGAALVVGRDREGRVYTSRSNKGLAERYYNDYQYRQTPANAGFINAHNYLKMVHENTMERGSAYEVEVLYGRQPNAIVYGTNGIVFLRPLIGDDGELSPPINDERWGGTIFRRSWDAVPTIGFVSLDGKTIQDDHASTPWRTAMVPTVNSAIFGVPHKNLIQTFVSWLEADMSGWTNEDLLNANLTSVPVADRPVVKQLRENAQYSAELMKQRIVQPYIDTLRTMTSGLCDMKLRDGEDIGIEGVVFLNPETQEQFKIVNKLEFTSINAFNHLVRNSIRKTSHGKIDPKVITFGGLHQLSDVDSIYDGFLQSMNNQLWPVGANLHSGMGIKRELRKHQADVYQRTLDNVVEWLTLEDNRHVAVFRSSVVHHCKIHLALLNERREWYLDKMSEFGIQLDGGRWLGYSKAIHNRTMLMFAELEIELNTIREVASFARDKRVIIEEIFRKQLAGL
jgi:hypothetical protein